MKQSDIFRDNAENCLKLAEIAPNEPAFKRFTRMARAGEPLQMSKTGWMERIEYAA